ncbi:MAG: DUF86 domain-containing protein [Chloroflexota bacterium]|nr:DUF86 domain-containing protein [Chloroflexota bacterium]
MTRSQRLYCSDILDCIGRIENYTAAGRLAFFQSRQSQDAVMYCFTIIGEAIKQLDEDMTDQQPHIDWSGFARFRDFLIHQYQNTELDIIWTVVQDDLAALQAAIEAILGSLDASDQTGAGNPGH